MLSLNNDNFELKTKEGNVILDFWAEWCGPCRMLGPVFESLSEEMSDFKFAKINVDESQELAGKFGVRSIPTVVFLRDGGEIDRFVGALPKDSLKLKIEEVFK